MVSFREDQGRWIEVKMDWKRLENGFRSYWILGCEASLAGWFWLSKLGKLNGGWPSIYRKANGIKMNSKWCVLEGIRVGLHHEESLTQTWSKLSQIVCFMMLITSGKLLNMIRSKKAWKNLWLEAKLKISNSDLWRNFSSKLPFFKLWHSQLNGS